MWGNHSGESTVYLMETITAIDSTFFLLILNRTENMFIYVRGVVLSLTEHTQVPEKS